MMTDFKQLVRQYWRWGFLAIVVIVLVTIIGAISGDGRLPGSSYSRAANGYSSWYQMMVSRGVKINRWQKPFTQLDRFSKYQQNTILLQVTPQLEPLSITSQQQAWIDRGNTLIILGITAPSTEIPFTADLNSAQGQIRIETTRRFRSSIRSSKIFKDAAESIILEDKSGSVITQFKLGKGRIIIATTPYLAANAYQEFSANYELLATLITADRQQILVDEYIHGYVDRDRKSVIDPITGELREEAINDSSNDALDYLLSTPLIVVLVNLLLGVLVLAWQQNRRFGKIVIPKIPEIDNSEAYIQALGGVLRQANSSEFVLENIGKAEQLAWQQKLGLGKERLVSAQTLITAWENQTQLPTEDLRFVLQLTAGARRITPADLNIWLTKIREIDRQLSSSK